MRPPLFALFLAACAPEPTPIDTGPGCTSESGVAGLGDLTAAGFTGTEVLDTAGALATDWIVWDDGSHARVTTWAQADTSTVAFSADTCPDGSASGVLDFDVLVGLQTEDGRLDETLALALRATAADAATVAGTVWASSLHGDLRDLAADCTDCDDPTFTLDLVMAQGWSTGAVALWSGVPDDDGVRSLAEGSWDGQD